MKKLLITVVCLVGFSASLYDVAEANNPMPMPDYDQVCQYNCVGPSFSFEGLLWALVIPGIIFLLVMMNKKEGRAGTITGHESKKSRDPLYKREGKAGTKTGHESKESHDPNYKGSYKNWKFHGTGTYTYSDGTTYEGEWKNGKCHGKGTQTNPDGHTLSGQWQDGHFLGKSTVKKVAKKSASSPARTKRLSSNPDASKVAKPIREINRYGLGNPTTSSPKVSSSIRKDLQELKSLLDDGLINEADYDKKKSELLEKM